MYVLWIWLCCLLIFKLVVGLSVELFVGEFELFKVFVVLIKVIRVIVFKLIDVLKGINNEVIIGIVVKEELIFNVIISLMRYMMIILINLWFLVNFVKFLIKLFILFVVFIMLVNLLVVSIIILI